MKRHWISGEVDVRHETFDFSFFPIKLVRHKVENGTLYSLLFIFTARPKVERVLCEVCDIWTSGPINFEDHLKGKAHARVCLYQDYNSHSVKLF